MKTKSTWLLTPILLVLSITLAAAQAFADDGGVRRGQMTSAIEYLWVGDEDVYDDEGRLLAWEGTVVGDFTGEMKWWFEAPPAPSSVSPVGLVAFYAARWEIWDGDELLLAGESAGKTVFPDFPDFNGIWDGHGVVTEASEEFNPLKGRKVYETGPVIAGSEPEDPLFTGTGMFVIY